MMGAPFFPTERRCAFSIGRAYPNGRQGGEAKRPSMRVVRWRGVVVCTTRLALEAGESPRWTWLLFPTVIATPPPVLQQAGGQATVARESAEPAAPVAVAVQRRAFAGPWRSCPFVL